MTVPTKNNVVVTFQNKTIVRVILIIVATLLGLDFLHRISKPLVLIFIAFFLALALNPAVDWIARKLKSKSRIRATGVAYILVLSLLITFFSLVLPPLIRQTVAFVQDVPQTISDFKYQDSGTARFVRRYRLDEQLDDLSGDISNRLPNLSKPILSTAGRVGGTLIGILTVLVLTFMMLVEGPAWLQKLWALMPSSKREHRKQLAGKMYRVVTGYVNGQVLIAAIAGGFALIALLIASSLVNASVNAVALAGIITLFGLIPLIGNTLGAIVVVLACLFVSAPLALIMAAFFLIYQQIENVTIQPYIQSKSNQMTPLLVFVSALMGVGFGGIFGAFVAIPIAGCAKILVEDYLEKRQAATD